MVALWLACSFVSAQPLPLAGLSDHDGSLSWAHGHMHIVDVHGAEPEHVPPRVDRLSPLHAGHPVDHVEHVPASIHVVRGSDPTHADVRTLSVHGLQMGSPRLPTAPRLWQRCDPGPGAHSQLLALRTTVLVV